MTFDRSFSTNQRSESCFRSALPPTWLKREQRPDFYIDFIVELDGADGPSGIKCAVQLKGTASPKYCKSGIKQRVRIKHLEYYVDRSPDPVFLVVVDVERGRAFWIHMQHWIKSHPEWRTKKSVVVEVPTENTLDDIDAFRRAIEQAVASMRSVASAADSVRKRYEQADGRFKVDVSFENGTTRVTLNPREAVDGRIRALGAESREKLTNLLEKGHPTHFLPGELSLEGSRIFTEILREASDSGVTLQAAKHLTCSASLFLVDEGGRERPIISNLASHLEAGTREVRLEIPIPKSPLTLRCRMGVGEGTELGDGAFNLSFEYRRWVGQALLYAAQFDRVEDVVRYAAERRPMSLHVEVDGNTLLKIQIVLGNADTFAGMDRIVEVLSKARRVCRHLRIAPSVPEIENLARDEYTLLQVWHLIDVGQEVQPVTSASGTIECTVRTLRLLIAGKRPLGSLDLSVEFYDPVPAVLGCLAEGWYLRRQVTRLALTPESERLVRAYTGDDDDVLSATAQASPESMCTTSLEFRE